MRVEFLPPYSPDYNPIEQAFSVIKAQLRREGSIARNEMREKDDSQVYLRLLKLVFSITPTDARGFFYNSMYF